MIKIADEHRLPFAIKVPNSTTKEAVAQLESGKAQRFNTLNELVNDLTKNN